MIILFRNKISDTLNIDIEKYYKYVLGVLLLIVIGTSIYKIGVVPKGMNIDEAGMFVDAKNLAQHGFDRYFNKWPIYLINFGGGQSIMYAYLTAFLIKIFGNHLILAKIPSIIFRILAFLSTCLLLKNEKNKKEKLIFLLLLAIAPYFIMQSRWGLDCNLLVSFLTISISVFIYSIEKQNNKLFFISGVFFGLTLYTYSLSYLIIPILLSFILIFLLKNKKISIKQIIVLGFPIFILSIPLILLILVNYNIIPEIKSFITIPKLPNFRSGEISFTNIPNSLRIIINVMTFDGLFGGKYLIYNALPEFGTLYYISIPFFLVGIIDYIKKEKRTLLDVTMFIWLLSVIICSLLLKDPNINKANAIFVPLVYFISKGIMRITNQNKKILFGIILIYSMNFILFTNFYYNQYNQKYDNPPFFATHYIEAVEYADQQQEKEIYIDPTIEKKAYIYIEMNHKIISKESDTIRIKTKDKTYHFKKIKEVPENSIYITKQPQVSQQYKMKQIGNVYVIIN